MGQILSVQGVSVTFGGLRALAEVDLDVPKGGFVGLIGPNGAGKTTFIDAVTGYVPTSGGSVTFDGDDISGLKVHQRSQRGLVRTFQSMELFEDLTVRENLLVAAQTSRWSTIFRDMIGRSKPSADLAEAVDWALELLHLHDASDALPTDLSHGRRKLVAVARALAARPGLVMLDEPAAGLDSTESLELARQLRSLLDHTISVFLIDHDMGLVLSVCDYIYVLDFGAVIASGTPDEIRSNPEVIRAYLGERSGSRRAEQGAEP